MGHKSFQNGNKERWSDERRIGGMGQREAGQGLHEEMRTSKEEMGIGY